MRNYQEKSEEEAPGRTGGLLGSGGNELERWMAPLSH